MFSPAFLFPPPLFLLHVPCFDGFLFTVVMLFCCSSLIGGPLPSVGFVCSNFDLPIVNYPPPPAAPRAQLGDLSLKEHDIITIDGSTGEVYLGTVDRRSAAEDEDFQTVLKWADEARKLKARLTVMPSQVTCRLFLSFGLVSLLIVCVSVDCLVSLPFFCPLSACCVWFFFLYFIFYLSRCLDLDDFSLSVSVSFSFPFLLLFTRLSLLPM